ncbi:MAG: hypothetical protein ACLQOZ_14425 [Acidimicrobiales bacterium]
MEEHPLGARGPTGPSAPATTGAHPARLTALAFGAVIVPFAIILGRFALASGRHLTLPDDLALIDLHTREALRWKQQLGVFDHNGWNHPGPAYFYLLSVAYRLFGSGARAEFIGATAINALAAVGCVWVVRRRTSPVRSVWAAAWVGLLGLLLASIGPGATTYSEGALGALVSPWNPTVVIYPLLLFILLCAAALARSWPSLLGAVLVGSFVIQTNISSLPLVMAVLAAAVAGWLGTVVVDRRRRSAPAGRPTGSVWWAAGAAVVFVAMWAPPVVQQVTNHPGNLTLIYRFFTAGHPTQSLGSALRSVVAVNGVLVEGPSEVMSSWLGGTPAHVVGAVTATVAVVLAGVATTVAGVRQRARFAAGLGALSLVGGIATVAAASQVVGPIYGYLLVWGVAVPVAACIGTGMVRWPGPRLPDGRPLTSTAAARLALCGVAVAVSGALSVRLATLPPLDTVSDPTVGSLVSLVTPGLDRSGTVFVGDNGFTDARCQPDLIPTEQFIGLVDQLDQLGYHPRVNSFWKAQFGPGYQTTGHENRQVELSQWSPASPAMTGYRGRLGEIAVTVSDRPDPLPATHCTPSGGPSGRSG